MKEINIRQIPKFRIGNAQNVEGGTGCTVVICDEGTKAGVSVKGGGPATRETDLLDPQKMVQEVFGVCISGGSAYGLDSATGVMQYLEERGIGFDVGMGYVPIVPAACLFDLEVADFKCRPDKAMGYQACVDSENWHPEGADLDSLEPFTGGNKGAGTGATVGKFKELENMMKSGLGTYAVQSGDLMIGAVVAVNALGDVYDVETGEEIAGMLCDDGKTFDPVNKAMWESVQVDKNVFTGNTTIGFLITNAELTKDQCNKLADMAHDGYARTIKPVHTSADGDTIFFLAKGDVKVSQDALGDLGSYVMAKAINNAVRSAETAYGAKAACDL